MSRDARRRPSVPAAPGRSAGRQPPRRRRARRRPRLLGSSPGRCGGRAGGAAWCCSPIAATARPSASSSSAAPSGSAPTRRGGERAARRRSAASAAGRCAARASARASTAPSAVVETDHDGYFRVEMAPGEGGARRPGLAPARPRHGGARAVAACAEVYIPPAAARVVVVSDIDDTVMHTGVANKAAMLWRLFVRGRREPHRVSRRRGALPGAARRAGGRRGQPDALRLARALGHLRDPRGVLPARTKSRSARSSSCANGGSAGGTRCRGGRVDHKRHLIEAMMRLYDGMPFVLIGDSGQHDPEIYAGDRRPPCRAGARGLHPRRRRARSRARRRGRRHGRGARAPPAAHLVLAADSAAIAEDAARLGLISAEAVGGGRGPRRGAPAGDVVRGPAWTRNGRVPPGQAVDQLERAGLGGVAT